MCYLRTLRRKTTKALCLMAAVAVTLGFAACESRPDDAEIDFVGDSIIARWDVAQDLPSYLVYNYGRGGSGINLLESYNSRFSGKDVVVISGTNDNFSFMPDRRNEYAQRYLSAILSLTDRKIYLFSVLPRGFEGDRAGINDDIEAFNLIIQHRVKDIGRVKYLDLFDDFKKGDAIDVEYFSDGLHPNIIGYEILTQKLLNAL